MSLATRGQPLAGTSCVWPAERILCGERVRTERRRDEDDARRDVPCARRYAEQAPTNFYRTDATWEFMHDNRRMFVVPFDDEEMTVDTATAQAVIDLITADSCEALQVPVGRMG